MSSFWTLVYQQGMKTGTFLARTFCVFHVTTNYIGFGAYGFGGSMMPTIDASGTVLIVERITNRVKNPVRGDVVVFMSPENPRKTPLKRVVGVEGDSLSVVIDPNKSHQSQTVVVPKGHVWVQGDYIQNSRDSRTFGPVPCGLIQGRVLWKVWPFKDFGPLGPTPT